jgi:hypothetical protein
LQLLLRERATTRRCTFIYYLVARVFVGDGSSVLCGPLRLLSPRGEILEVKMNV